MDEGTNDGHGSSQDEALDQRFAAFEERVLGKMTELLGSAGKGQGDGDGDANTAVDEKQPPDDDDTPGWFRRLIGVGKKTKPDEGRKSEKEPDKAQPDSQASGAQKSDKSDADDAPSWAKELAKRFDTLEQRQGRGVSAKVSEVLDRLYVMPKARKLVPDFDPFTEDGLAEAEKWASENPEFLTVRRQNLPEIKLEDLPEPGAYGPDKAEMQRVLANVRPEDWRV